MRGDDTGIGAGNHRANGNGWSHARGYGHGTASGDGNPLQDGTGTGSGLASIESADGCGGNDDDHVHDRALLTRIESDPLHPDCLRWLPSIRSPRTRDSVFQWWAHQPGTRPVRFLCAVRGEQTRSVKDTCLHGILVQSTCAFWSLWTRRRHRS